MPSQTVSNSEPLVPAHQALSEGLAQAIAACQTLTAAQGDQAPLAALWQQLQAAQETLAGYSQNLPPISNLEDASAIAPPSPEAPPAAASATPQLPKVITDCQRLFEISTDAIVWLENGVFIDCNQATVQLMGYAHKAELLGKSPVALSPEVQPDGMPSLQKAQEILPLVLQQGSHRFEWMHQRTNGDRFWVEILLTAIDSNGRQLIHGIWRDITDRKAAEAELDEQEQLLRSTYEGVNHSIVIIDVISEHDFQYVGWNPATEQSTGIFSTAIVGKTPEEALGVEIGTKVRQQYEQCVTAGTTISYEEFLPLDGQAHWWLTTLNPLKDANGRIFRIVLTTVEISERKATEIALQQKEVQYRSIFESINDGIFIIDLSTGQTLSVNPAVCKMHGYSYEEFVQLSPSDYVHPDSLPVFAQFIATVQAGQQFITEAIDLHKDGTPIPIEVIGVPFEYDEKPCVLAVVRDISERKRLEAERKAAEAELYEQEQVLRSTYEGVDHCIVIVDVTPDGDFHYLGWNPATAKRTGITNAMALGQTPATVFGAEPGAHVRQSYQRCLEVGRPMTYEELLPLQGQDNWWLTTLNPLKDEHGQIYRIVVTAVDITDRKVTEFALQQQESQYRSIFESINDGIF
ncbi:MAG: PAS domain S-box protein, partial [Cyanobacteria bacterium J06659_2]